MQGTTVGIRLWFGLNYKQGFCCCLQRCSALQLASLGVRGRSWHYPYTSIREVIDISAEPLKFQLKSGGSQEPASAIVCVWNYLQVISHVFSQMLFQFKDARTRPQLHLVTQFPSNHKKKPRGWFGTLVIFPYLGNNNANWFSYFQRGWNHQPVVYLTLTKNKKNNGGPCQVIHSFQWGVARCMWSGRGTARRFACKGM